jgi:hypothetical protein
MAWRYRNRETKQLASAADYKRSRSQGGTKFERFSDAKWKVSRGAKSSNDTQNTRQSAKRRNGRSSSEKAESSSPAKLPQTPQEYERIMEDRLKKMSRRKREQFYEAEYDQVEYETGVDY